MNSAAPLGDDPLRLWRSVADLSVRVLPEPGPADARRTVKDYLPEHCLPWDLSAGHLSLAPRRSWRHTVFAGLMPHRVLQEAVRAALDGRTGTDGPRRSGAPGTPKASGTVAAGRDDAARTIAVLALRVSESGKVEPTSPEISRAWWLAARIVAGGPLDQALEGFEAAQEAWRDEALELLASRRVRVRGLSGRKSNGGGTPTHQLDHADVAALLQMTRRHLDPDRRLPWMPSTRTPRPVLRVASRLTDVGTEAAVAASETLLLNHPVAAPLDAAQGRTRFRQAAGGLLGVDAPEETEDVLESRQSLYYAVAPCNVPWGTSSMAPPSLASQFAVDAALHRLQEADGVWTAPPSTAAGAPGPELSDAIASALLTRRGLALAEIPDLVETFDPEPLGTAVGQPAAPDRAVHPLHPDLHGTEYVHLVPPAGPVPGAGPFGVRVVLAPGMDRTEPFTGLKAGTEIGAVAAVDAVLNRLPSRRAGFPDAEYRTWAEETAALLAARDRVDEELRRRQQYHEAVPLLLRSRAMTRDIQANIDDADFSVQALEERRDQLEGLQRAARRRWSSLNDAIARHLGEEPSVWRRALTGGRARVPWRTRLEQLREKQIEALSGVEEQQVRIEDARRSLRQALDNLEALRNESADAEASTEALVEELRAYPYPENLVDTEWLQGAPAGKEITCPWLDPGVQRARHDVFDRAVRLHALTVWGLAEEFRAGLLTARDLLSGRPGASQDAVHTAWQVLCLVFPEVRIAPENFPELASTLGRHRLGWALLGEADRLAPGVAYACLSRVRRGILVRSAGPARDPEFLEPDADLQDLLARAASCSPEWAPARSSAWSLGLGFSRYRRKTPAATGAETAETTLPDAGVGAPRESADSAPWARPGTP